MRGGEQQKEDRETDQIGGSTESNAALLPFWKDVKNVRFFFARAIQVQSGGIFLLSFFFFLLSFVILCHFILFSELIFCEAIS